MAVTLPTLPKTLALQNRILRAWNHLAECRGLTCGHPPGVLTVPLQGLAGSRPKLRYSHLKLMDSAIRALLSDSRVAYGLLGYPACAGNYDLLCELGLKLSQPQRMKISNQLWLNECKAIMDAVEELFGEEYDQCPEPCEAPCECPCGGWPREDFENPGYANPEAFPCGGLLYQYSLSSFSLLEIYHPSSESCSDAGQWPLRTTLVNPITLTAIAQNSSELSCVWTGVGDVEIVNEGPGGTTTETTPAEFTLSLVTTGEVCRWEIGVMAFPASGGGSKLYGQTPVGSYQLYGCFPNSGYGDSIKLICSAVVS
jgi:hypothetical protein